MLNKSEVQRWLRDQKAALQRVEEERVGFLTHLTGEESLRIYLDLKEGAPTANGEDPSPLLSSMRQALDRHARQRRTGHDRHARPKEPGHESP